MASQPSGASSTNRCADVVGEPDAPGRAGGELLAGDEPVGQPAVQGGGRQAQLVGGVGHGEQLSFGRVVVGWWQGIW